MSTADRSGKQVDKANWHTFTTNSKQCACQSLHDFEGKSNNIGEHMITSGEP
jgi:hypothetical protein